MAVERIIRFTRNIACDALSYLGFIPVKFETDFMISASNGLYLLKQGKLRRLLKGNMFGVTQVADNTYLAFNYVQNGTKDERSFSQVFELDGYKATNVKPFSFRDSTGNSKVPVRVHQIRKYNDYLFVTNTRQNTIWKTDLNGNILCEWAHTEVFEYDEGSTDTNAVRRKARASDNYHHFNSLHVTDDFIYVLAHNSAGEDRSKNSFMLKLSHDFEVVERVDELGKACHDLVPYKGSFYYCDSANGKVRHPEYATVDVGMFTRGMAIFDQHLLVAGTVITTNQAERGRGFSKLFVIPTSASSPVCTIQLGRLGDIHDINVV